MKAGRSRHSVHAHFAGQNKRQSVKKMRSEIITQKVQNAEGLSTLRCTVIWVEKQNPLAKIELHSTVSMLCIFNA